MDSALTNLVPRAHDPFGLRQGSRALAGSDPGACFDWLLKTQKNQTGNHIEVNIADDTGTPTKRFSCVKNLVCRTCNSNIILKNHPVHLFGEKAKEERIVKDLEKFFGLKITRDD